MGRLKGRSIFWKRDESKPSNYYSQRDKPRQVVTPKASRQPRQPKRGIKIDPFSRAEVPTGADRYVVFTSSGTDRRAPCSKTTYTSYGDAAKATLRCAQKATNTKTPCLLLMGLPGAERIVGRCAKDGRRGARCGRPKTDDAALIKNCAPPGMTKDAKAARRAEIKRLKEVREDAVKRQLWIAREQGSAARSTGPSQATSSRSGKLGEANRRRRRHRRR